MKVIAGSYEEWRSRLARSTEAEVPALPDAHLQRLSATLHVWGIPTTIYLPNESLAPGLLFILPLVRKEPHIL